MPRDASRSNLLQSIVRHPALPALLDSMESRELAGVIGRVGLADAAELMELVPKRKLLRTLDDAIWKSPRAGAAERLDRDEFIGWLEVWNDIGEEFLIDRLEGIRDDYLAVLLGSVVRIGFVELGSDDSDEREEPPVYIDSGGDRYGPFLVFPRVDDHEDVVRATLLALWTNSPDRLLRLLGQLEPQETMLDRSAARAALEEDVRAGRLRFREASGYVNAEDARTFLLYATVLSMDDIDRLRAYDESSARSLAAMAADMPVTNPIEAEADEEEEHSAPAEEAHPSTDPVGDLRALLERAELIDPPPEQKLLADLRESRQWTLEADLRTLAIEDFAAFEQRMREVVYLANVLIAGVHLRGAAFDPLEAREAALAVASFGLQLLRKRGAGGGLREKPGLVRAFLAGWKTLQGIPRRVVDAFDTAALALEATSAKSRWLQEQVLSGVDDLRQAVAQRRWDDARDAAIFLSIAFDSRLCRAAGALLDDLPRYPLAFMDEQRTDMKWIESLAELETIARSLAELGKQAAMATRTQKG